MALFTPLFVPKVLIWLWPSSGFGALMDEKMTYNKFPKPNSNSFKGTMNFNFGQFYPKYKAYLYSGTHRK